MQPSEALIANDGPRVWIVGRSALARTGVRTILEEYGAVVLGTTLTSSAITEAVDVVVMLERTAEPFDDSAVLIISDEWDEAPAAQIWGMIPSDASPKEIWAAVVALSVGLCVLPPEWISRHQRMVPPNAGYHAIEPLTERETEVLHLLAEGLTNRQMAARLEISEHTIKFHLSSIFSKLDAASRTEAIRIGAQHGLIVW